MKIAKWIAGALVAFLVVIIAVAACSTTPGQTDRSVASPSVATTTGSAPPAPSLYAQTPAAAPEVQAGPAAEADAGTYEVGVDLAPGRYKTAGPDQSDYIPHCYYARLRDDSGTFGAIIANDNLQGPGSVTIKAGEFVEFNGSCHWTKQ